MRRAALAIALLSVEAIAFAGPNGVPDALLAKLHTGVNITRWLCYTDAKDTSHFETYWQDDDFAALKRIHATFVRLCLSPEIAYDNGQPNATNQPYIDKAVERLSQHGLAILFDLHDNGQLKLDEVGHDNSGFVSFWRAMAEHYRGRMEDSLVFELLNEPVFQKNPETWYALQERTAQTIRAVDPKRTILVAPTNWSGVDSLVKMEPLGEKNLIYTFHCYDPFWFTHQGATWAGELPKLLKGVPFPSSPEALQPVIASLSPQVKDILTDYGNQRYGAQYLHDRLAMGMDWGKLHHVPVVLGEYGAYPLVSPPDSRARWFDGVRAAIDQTGVPNALWGYDDGFGLGRTRGSDGKLKLDGLTLQHLYGWRE